MNVFRSRTISVAFYGKFDTCWLKNSQTRDQPTLARLRELTSQTWIKTRVDLRRRFCFPYLKYDANWSQWEMWFLQVFVMKTSIRLFSSNEHEMNLNKRRRQLQYPWLGVLVFLWRNFLEFWFLLPGSWQLFMAKMLQGFPRSWKVIQANFWGSFKRSKNNQYLRKKSKRVLHQSNTRSL